MKVTLHYIKLHSGMHLQTTTIILALNEVNSNSLNSSSQYSPGSFIVSFQMLNSCWS